MVTTDNLKSFVLYAICGLRPTVKIIRLSIVVILDSTQDTDHYLIPPQYNVY